MPLNGCNLSWLIPPNLSSVVIAIMGQYLTHSVLMHYNINYYTPDAQETAYEEERYSLLLNKNESYSDVDSEYYYFHLLANIFYTELNQILCDYLS